MSEHYSEESTAEAEDFTEAEIDELTALFRAMNDVHRAELGQFRWFREGRGRGRDGGDLHANEEKDLLVVLRKIRASGDGGGSDGSVLCLDFDGVCNRYVDMPTEAEIEASGSTDFWDLVLERYSKMNSRLHLAQHFSRRKDKRPFWRLFLPHCNKKRVIRGLGHLIHSLPPEVNLVSLHIARNLFTFNDVMLACNVFKGMANLIELDLSYNRIGEAGGVEVFSTLLGHPSCNLRKLKLEGNPLGCSGCQKEDPVTSALVTTLRDTNRSLVELDLTRTHVRLRPAILDMFVPFPENNWDLFEFASNRNHHLKVLTLDGDIADDEQQEQTLELTLQAILRWHAAGPAPALATKIERYFDKNVKSTFYNKTPEHVGRCLELIGRHGNLFTSINAVIHFQAQGSLFG